MGTSKSKLRAGANLTALELVRALGRLGLPQNQVYDIAFNVLLVAHGARTATLIESADYRDLEPDVFVKIMRLLVSLQTHFVNIDFAVRESAAPQFLVYNKERVPETLVQQALDDDTAMGKVLGFQCAGDLRSPYSVIFYVTPDHEMDATFYVEMCRDPPDEEHVEQQLAAFQRVASQFGWSVRYEIKHQMSTDAIVDVLRTGEHIEDIRMQLQQDLDNKMMDVLASAVESRKHLNRRLLAAALRNGNLEYDALDNANLYPLTQKQVKKVEKRSRRSQVLLLPETVYALSQRQITSVTSWYDVLALIAQRDFSKLRNKDTVATMTQMLKRTCAPDALSLVLQHRQADAAWDAFYVFVAFRILNNPVTLFGIDDPFCINVLRDMLR